MKIVDEMIAGDITPRRAKCTARTAAFSIVDVMELSPVSGVPQTTSRQKAGQLLVRRYGVFAKALASFPRAVEIPSLRAVILSFTAEVTLDRLAGFDG